MSRRHIPRTGTAKNYDHHNQEELNMSTLTGTDGTDALRQDSNKDNG